MRTLTPGTDIIILDRLGTTIRSYFLEADDASLRVRDGALSNRIARADVLEIAVAGKGKGSASGAAGGALAGAAAAFLVDMTMMFARCNGSCTGNVAIMVLASVGLPTAGGFAGYYGFRRPAQRVIYRAPSVQ